MCGVATKNNNDNNNIRRLILFLASLVAQKVKNLPAMQETQVQFPGSGKSPGEGNDYPLEFSCLGNPLDRRAWQAIQSMEWQKSRTQLSDQTTTNPCTYMKCQFSSVDQSCPTLCDPMNHSTPGLPVHHKLPEFTQTHIHRVSDAIQPSHPLSSPFPPAPNPSQHQSLFQ